MKALVISGYGSSDVVSVQEQPAPTPTDDEVLIDVHAAGLNPLDYKIRAGQLRRLRSYRFPLILGNELSGVVAAVGRRVTAFKPGDEVFARVGKDQLGAFAEQATVAAAYVARKPKNLSHVEAASIPLVGLTSYQALVEYAELKAGQKVLIHAGAGGIGTFAIQLAKRLGATVATTTSSRNEELVRRLGADVVIDYTKTDFTTALKNYDVVYDTLGGDTLLKSFKVVRRGGIVVSIAAAVPDGPTARELGLNAFMRVAIRLMNAGILGTARRCGVRYRFLFMRPDGEQLAKLADSYEKGELVPIVDRTFKLDAGADALRYVETGRARGKVILKIRD